MSETYTPDMLEKIQFILTDMMRQFDRICKDNGIEYFVCFGTAIGAVRHQGFIPWDDDIDIGMMRTEYDKLKKVFETQDTGNLFLGSPDGDYEWQDKIFPKLYYKDTVFISESWNNDFEKSGEGYGRPINFDIFLFDYADDNTEEIIKKALKIKRRYIYYKFKSRLIKDQGLVSFISSLVKRLMYDFHHKDPDKSKKLYEEYLKLVTHPGNDYIICYDTLVPSDITGSLIRYDHSFPTVTMKFEDTEVQLQNGYDEALTAIYGDYMKLPPEDQRVAHKPYYVSFGDYQFP
ncbi:MAG: LicD family protein [Saccharofermentans sp.]|nr:LicD family protein [Saccharofermentans sp.]